MNEILIGNCLDILKGIPAGMVDCCVTSPPYWGLRDYGIPATDWPEVTFCPMPGLPPVTIPAEKSVHGLEKNIWAYVAHEVLIFQEVKRVLAPHGVLFLNLGDAYTSGNRATYRSGASNNKGHQVQDDMPRPDTPSGLKPKDLCGIPWRVALALQADGWWLRQDIVWAKKSPMPESVRDRCTRAHEYIFVLTKQANYYWDAEGIKEPGVSPEMSKEEYAAALEKTSEQSYVRVSGRPREDAKSDNNALTGCPPGGRNKRSVWTLGPDPCKDAHFATFPKAIPEICIRAACPREVCTVCGRPRERILEKSRMATRPGENTKIKTIGPNSRMRKNHDPAHPEDRNRSDEWYSSVVGNRDPERHVTETQTVGWTDCGHNSYRPGRVLDPFGGIGTVGYVAAKLKRDYLLIDLNPDYAQNIAAYRLQEAEIGLPAKEAKNGQLALFGETAGQPKHPLCLRADTERIVLTFSEDNHDQTPWARLAHARER